VQYLGGGDGVDGCQCHDDFVHERGVLDSIKCLLVPVS
jgi:hypothetical protein